MALIAPLYLYAQLRGDSSARAYAGALAIAALLGWLPAAAPSDPLWIDRNLLSLDALLLGVQIVICLRSPRLYPIAIAAAQLLAVLVECFAAAKLAEHQAAAAYLLTGLALLQLVIFVCGLIAHRSRRPFWRVRGRPEKPSSDLAPRANGAR
ncbi:MAG: hypothetical protein ACKOQM_11400 [Novosphingobium sp.]